MIPKNIILGRDASTPIIKAAPNSNLHFLEIFNSSVLASRIIPKARSFKPDAFTDFILPKSLDVAVTRSWDAWIQIA